MPAVLRRAWMPMLALALILGGLGAGCAALRKRRPGAISEPMPVLLVLTNPASWETGTEPGDRKVLLSPILETRAAWNEAVVSWNVEPAEDAGLVMQALLPGSSGTGPLYNLGAWSLDDAAGTPRSSVRGQRDETAQVKTDTLVIAGESRALRLRVELRGDLMDHPSRLKWVAVSFSDTRAHPGPRPPNPRAWGRSLQVPERSQIAQPGGEAWCSPTSVSMVLAWWAEAAGRPGWDRAVAEVARGVHDPGWGGTGNWSFNMAYAGSLPGMRAVAARLRDLRAVEDLVMAGIPVVLSVNAPALRGKPITPDGGHLVICTGFTETGDVIANDPYARLEQGQRVRRVYPRENVDRAWTHAHRLAYLIAPEAQARAFPAVWR